MKSLTTQQKDKIVNIEQCDSVWIDSGGLSVNINTGQVLIGRYDSEEKKEICIEQNTRILFRLFYNAAKRRT